MAINKINSKSIEDLQISAADLASGSISTGKIQDNAITGIKIANSIDVTDVNVSGSLGVGTTDPQDKVHIYKGSSGKVGFANNTALLIEDDSNVAIQLSSPSSTNGQILFGDESSNASGMIQYEHDNNRLGIFTNVSRRISIDSDGIKFGTDTAAANALDDYEEGTFTPTIEGSSTAGTATYSDQVGKYTKIGNIVTIQIQLGYSGGTGSGTAMYIKGLPFTGANLIQSLAMAYTNNISLPTNRFVRANVLANGNFIRLFTDETGGGATNDLAYDSAGEIAVGGTYLI